LNALHESIPARLPLRAIIAYQILYADSVPNSIGASIHFLIGMV